MYLKLIHLSIYHLVENNFLCLSALPIISVTPIQMCSINIIVRISLTLTCNEYLPQSLLLLSFWDCLGIFLATFYTLSLLIIVFISQRYSNEWYFTKI